MSTEEVYKVIPEYPRYSISNYGNVINNTTGKRIAQRKATNGYMRFNVRRGDTPYEKPKTLTTHRTVAQMFLPKPVGKDYINHKDADKTNNYVGNLEWCTPQENSIHASETIPGLKEKYRGNIEKATVATLRSVTVYKDGVQIGTYRCMRDTAKALGINVKTVYNGLHGMKNRQGYIFKREGASDDL